MFEQIIQSALDQCEARGDGGRLGRILNWLGERNLRRMRGARVTYFHATLR